MPTYLDDQREQLLRVIARDLCDGDWKAALATLRQQSDAFPESGIAWELQGLIEAHLELHAEAISSLERAAILVPLQPLASRCLGLEYVEIGKRDLGVDVLASLAAIHAEPTLVSLVNHDLVQLGAFSAARHMLYELVQEHPQNAVFWHELGAALVGEGRLKEALHAAMQAAALDPQRASYRVTAASVFISLGHPEEAYKVVQTIEYAALASLSCDCCLWRLICIYDAYDDRDRAIVCYQQLNRIQRRC